MSSQKLQLFGQAGKDRFMRPHNFGLMSDWPQPGRAPSYGARGVHTALPAKQDQILVVCVR